MRVASFRLAGLVIALAFAAPLPMVSVGAVPQESLPAGCTTEYTMVPGQLGLTIPRFEDDCYHARTGLNGLDTPVIDVLLVTPATAFPERDLRVMRQAIEMWDAGIHFLAGRMGYDWLDAGVKIGIFTDDDAVTTDPLWDPEIVVVATNPAGGAGMGVEPYSFLDEAGFNPLNFIFPDGLPCKNAPNPAASLDVWNMLPGFRNDHGSSGTYVEECEGGAVCFAVNGAIDPVPGVVDVFQLYDLVAHEVGHCLSAGHVGDAGDHEAERVPYPDIMSYTNQPFNKCVSTLDVEAFALRMSQSLLATPWTANHPDGPGPFPDFQVQSAGDHWYASSTGLARDCPQPADGLVPPLTPVDFTPDAGAWPNPPGVLSGPATLYLHRTVDGVAGSSGNVETACLNLLGMDAEPPTDVAPALINAPGPDGGDHNPCYDGAEWLDKDLRTLHDATVQAHFWIEAPSAAATEALFDVKLFADGGLLAAQQVAVPGVGLPQELVVVFEHVTADAPSGHTLSVSIDPVFIVWGGSSPAGGDNVVLYDSTLFTSRLVIGGPGTPGGLADFVPDTGLPPALDRDGDGWPTLLERLLGGGGGSGGDTPLGLPGADRVRERLLRLL